MRGAHVAPLGTEASIDESQSTWTLATAGAPLRSRLGCGHSLTVAVRRWSLSHGRGTDAITPLRSWFGCGHSITVAVRISRGKPAIPIVARACEPTASSTRTEPNVQVDRKHFCFGSLGRGNLVSRAVDDLRRLLRLRELSRKVPGFGAELNIVDRTHYNWLQQDGKT